MCILQPCGFASIGKRLLVDHPRAHNSSLSLKQGDEKRVGEKNKTTTMTGGCDEVKLSAYLGFCLLSLSCSWAHILCIWLSVVGTTVVTKSLLT